MVLIRIVNRFIIILLLLLLLLITRYYNYLIRYLNYYPLKCREPRENGSREGVRRMGEGREKRERGKGEKKGDLIRETRLLPRDQSRRPRPIVRTRLYLHDCVPFTPLPFVSHARINRTHSRTPGCSVLEPPPRVLLAHGSVSPPPLEKKKEKKHTVS